ncbi:MAG: 50S ribosomal protein L21 [Candidatus Cloacimonadota bacterium]|nr:MAG: 50S ribosomal protein L21 [Candidatus Cloacimonadota bacterium]PIE79051.1 MAG: 50S ribosomal protein L21 [Candidatus Delongbacteria bacterium]
MYAVLKLGGNQHIVRKDDIIKVNRLQFDNGAEFEINEVLAIGEGEDVTFGTPFVEGAKIKFEVLENKKDKKVVVFKKKRRKGYERKKGHRQHISVVKVKEILK